MKYLNNSNFSVETYTVDDYWIDISGLTTLLDPEYPNGINRMLANYPGQEIKLLRNQIVDALYRIESYIRLQNHKLYCV